MTENPLPVMLVSPLSGDVELNLAYAREAMFDAITKHGEAPFPSHLLYPQVLDDLDPEERALGLACEHAWFPLAKRVVVYTDFGVSAGMQGAIDAAAALGMPRHMRTLAK